MTSVKKIVPLALLTFVVYAIVKSPAQAADLVHTFWDIIVQGVRGIGGFFDALLSKN